MSDCNFFFSSWSGQDVSGATTGERGKNDMESGNESMRSVEEYGAISGKKGKIY